MNEGRTQSLPRSSGVKKSEVGSEEVEWRRSNWSWKLRESSGGVLPPEEPRWLLYSRSGILPLSSIGGILPPT